ncbi:hydroxyacylglutathione hydrolase [Acidimangrovimonas pyrenivorans]|uniref:Hydroxyacylglutathione hydrolase n=1 Tax=Acidimangrovimonas pyrenivorans TaxID=2030798 RepID=A0ABV7ALU4_9RHOB
MPLQIVTVPCLSDNYAYIVKGPESTCVIDAPEAGPIIAELEARGWSLDSILITHHHHDHVGGVEELRAKYHCDVLGPKAEQDKLPELDLALADGDSGGEGDELVEVIAVPGHTLGHVAYYFPNGGAVFTADSLMAMGCGRVFEGTPEMMYHSLQRLAALPPKTLVYSGHEYTAANARFAKTIEPDNQELNWRIEQIDHARAEGEPTVPAILAQELETNPFLRAHLPQVKAAVGMPDAPDVAVFAEIRARKDRF